MTLHGNRLSILDHFFLSTEGPSTPMHIAVTLVFESGPLARKPGEIDLRALRTHVASRLHRAPRFRQHLSRTPLEGRMFWVDDTRFQLDRHVRPLRLPAGGGEKALKGAVAEILSQPLDHARPLWELWVVDGWSNERFAVVIKIHHCLADGVGALELLCTLLSPSADDPASDAPRWRPRRSPGLLDLLQEEVSDLAQLGADAAGILGAALLAPTATADRIQRGAQALIEGATSVLWPAQLTPINREVGPERRFEWLSIPLAELRLIKRRFGGTLNDIVLATVTGALRRYLPRRGMRFDRGEIRAAVPVSMRDLQSSSGNQVSVWLLPLPVDETDPQARLGRIQAATAGLKEGGNARELHSVLRLAEALGPTLAGAGAYFLRQHLPFNVIVTNVPGPQFPLYLSGARLAAVYPSVPLFENQGLGIALLSYDGMAFWGFLADPEIVPDLEEVVYAVAVSFCELLAHAAGEAPVKLPEEDDVTVAASA
jgi:diacylglycerol O-acyltransferase / wax synthase